MLSTFDSFDSIVNYLREPTLFSSVTGSQIIHNDDVKFSTQQTKEKDLTNVKSTTSPPQAEADVQILSKGRVRYGPITVNPRKQPSKTLFTGRRSKYEVLSGDDEEKRRDRRERNRVAATKCREKRENVLSNLENEHNHQINNNKHLLKMVNDLQAKKTQLELILTNHERECPLINSNNTSSSSMIFGDTSFLSSITDAPPLPLPTYQQAIIYTTDEEEELSHILDPIPILTNPTYTTDEEELSQMLYPTPILTNSAYNTNESNSLLISQPMTTSSIDRLLNNLQSPTISMENCNNHSMLFNSAIGSSCAKQHSNSSEDDSLPPKRTNHYVC